MLYDKSMNVAPPQIPEDSQQKHGVIKTIKQGQDIEGSAITDEDLTKLSVKSLAMHQSILKKVNLSSANLEKLDLVNDRLIDCDSIATNFDEASWKKIEVSTSRLSGVILTRGKLEDIVFEGCKLDLANFRYSKLKRVIFTDCHLVGADFYHTDMHQVEFNDCNLKEVDFSQSKLKSVDMRTSDISEVKDAENLQGVTITPSQLILIAPMLAKNLNIKIKD